MGIEDAMDLLIFGRTFKSDERECNVCMGTGKVIKRIYHPPFKSIIYKCICCNGTGVVKKEQMMGVKCKPGYNAGCYAIK